MLIKKSRLRNSRISKKSRKSRIIKKKSRKSYIKRISRNRKKGGLLSMSNSDPERSLITQDIFRGHQFNIQYDIDSNLLKCNKDFKLGKYYFISLKSGVSHYLKFNKRQKNLYMPPVVLNSEQTKKNLDKFFGEYAVDQKGEIYLDINSDWLFRNIRICDTIDLKYYNKVFKTSPFPNSNREKGDTDDYLNEKLEAAEKFPRFKFDLVKDADIVIEYDENDKFKEYEEGKSEKNNKYSYYLRNIPIKKKMKGYDSNVRVLIFSVTEKETGDIYFFYPEYSKNILDWYKKSKKKLKQVEIPTFKKKTGVDFLLDETKNIVPFMAEEEKKEIKPLNTELPVSEQQRSSPRGSKQSSRGSTPSPRGAPQRGNLGVSGAKINLAQRPQRGSRQQRPNNRRG